MARRGDSTGTEERAHAAGAPQRPDEARRYHRVQLLLALAELGLTTAYLVILLATGATAAVARAAADVSQALAWRVAVVAGAAGAGHAVLTAPLAWLRAFWLPRRHGLLHQSLAGWLGDRIKAAAVGGGLGLVVLEVIYGLLAATALWWLLAAAALVAIQALVALVVPIWLLPLFYRLAPLRDEDLRRRLLRLVERVGVPAVDVCVADQSRKSRTANAAVIGLGRTRRIVVFDTLLAGFTPAEIESVLAHEMAHHVHRDPWRALGLQAAVTVVTLGLADVLLRAGTGPWALEGPADPAGLPWLLLVLGALGLLATPLVNAYSRRLERRADDFALAITRDPDAFVGAMERLAALNLAERRPHPLKEALLYSHPSIERRIARARRPQAAAP
jgi:STE24 endopeptidase